MSCRHNARVPHKEPEFGQSIKSEQKSVVKKKHENHQPSLEISSIVNSHNSQSWIINHWNCLFAITTTLMAQKGWGKCNKCRGHICSKFDSPPRIICLFLLLVGCSFHTHIQPLVHLRESDLHVFSFFSMSHFKARENESHRKTHHTWSHKKVTWKHTRGKTQLKVTRLWFSSVFGVKCDYPMLLLSFCKLLKTRVLDFEKCSLHFLTPPSLRR